MIDYFWVVTLEATLPAGRGSTYASGVLTVRPPVTRQDLFRAAIAETKRTAGLAADSDVEVKFFYLEPNALP